MTDFTRDGDSDRRSISRRRFVSTTAAAGVFATGRTAAQNDDDGGGGDGGGSAANVGTTDTIENADEVRFDEAIPVGELAQLFIEFDTADHPVIGTDIQFQGSSSMRWPRTRSEPPSPPISSGTSSSGRRSHTQPAVRADGVGERRRRFARVVVLRRVSAGASRGNRGRGSALLRSVRIRPLRLGRRPRDGVRSARNGGRRDRDGRIRGERRQYG